MRSRLVLSICFLVVTCLLTSTARAVTQYAITDLGTLAGGGETEAHGVNDLGEVVGRSWTAGAWHAFSWKNGVMTDLTPAGSTGCCAESVNNAGEVVGYVTTAAGDTRAFLWQGGHMTDLGTLAGPKSAACGINDLGRVVGYSNYVGGPSYRYHAFLWQDGLMTDLGTLGSWQSYAYGINILGQVVGTADAATGSDHAFLWLPEPAYGLPAGMNDLGVGSTATAYDINALGQVVGQSLGASGRHGFLWQGGVLTDLGVLPGATSSYAYGINDSGQIVGTSGWRPFLWEDGMMADLNDLLQPGSGWELKGATDINECGQVVGYGLVGGRLHAYLLTPIAEPSALALLLLGGLGGLPRWRRGR